MVFRDCSDEFLYPKGGGIQVVLQLINQAVTEDGYFLVWGRDAVGTDKLIRKPSK